jgi:hypothetical protein
VAAGDLDRLGGEHAPCGPAVELGDEELVVGGVDQLGRDVRVMRQRVVALGRGVGPEARDRRQCLLAWDA